MLYGSLLTMVQGLISDESTETAESIRIWTNAALQLLETMYEWPELSVVEELTTDTYGLVRAPALMRTLTRLHLTSDYHYAFHEGPWRSGTAGQTPEYTYCRKDQVLINSGSLAVEVVQGSTVVESVSLFGSLAEGDPVGFAGVDGKFKVTSVEDATEIAIDPYYPGADGDNTMYTSPAGDYWLELRYLDAVASEVDVTLRYQRRLPEITLESDPILLPCPTALRFLVLQWALRHDKYDVNAERLHQDLQMALQREVPFAADASRQSSMSRHDGGISSPFALRNQRG